MFDEILMVVFDEPRQYQTEKGNKRYYDNFLLCDSWMSYILRYRNYSSSIAWDTL